MQNWQPCQNYYANSPKFSAASPKKMEKGVFNWKRLFLQDGPLGWWNAVLKNAHFSPKKSESDKMVQWTSEESSEKCSCGQLICRQESAVISFWNFLNVFGSKYENKRIFFLWNNCCPQNIPLGSSNGKSATLPNFFCQKFSKCLIQVRKTWKKLQFLKDIPFFSRRILKAHIKHFWQTLRTYFAKGPKLTK